MIHLQVYEALHSCLSFREQDRFRKTLDEPRKDADFCWVPDTKRNLVTVFGLTIEKRDFIFQQYANIPVGWRGWSYRALCDDRRCCRPAHIEAFVSESRKWRLPWVLPKAKNRLGVLKWCLDNPVRLVTVEEYLSWRE